MESSENFTLEKCWIAKLMAFVGIVKIQNEMWPLFGPCKFVKKTKFSNGCKFLSIKFRELCPKKILLRIMWNIIRKKLVGVWEPMVPNCNFAGCSGKYWP